MSASAYGLYLNHPTLAKNAYKKLGSRTDSYHRVDLPYESLSFHTGGVVYAPYTKTELGLFLWSDDDIPAGNRLRSSPHIIKEVEEEYSYGRTTIDPAVTKNIVLRTEHHPLQGRPTSNVYAIGYGVQYVVGRVKQDHGIFGCEVDCYSDYGNAGAYLGSTHVVLSSVHLVSN